MRKFALSLLLFLFTSQLLQAQIDSSKNPSPQQLHDYYNKKRKTNTTVGCIVLVSGAAMTSAGFLIHISELLDFGDPHYNATKGVPLLILGIATTIASIPLFVAAGKNRKRAQLALKK